MLQFTNLDDVNMYITIFIGLVLSVLCTFYERLDVTQHTIWKLLIWVVLPISLYLVKGESGGIAALLIVVFLLAFRSRLTHIKKSLYHAGNAASTEKI